jgi:hypothetical protein
MTEEILVKCDVGSYNKISRNVKILVEMDKTNGALT